jgi:hypothetical protein
MRARFAQLFLFSPSSGEPMGNALFALFPNVIGVPVMGSAPFALLPCVVRAPVFGRAYPGTPTLCHADLYEILRKLGGEGSKYFTRRANHFAF